MANEELAGQYIEADAHLRYEMQRFREYITSGHPGAVPHYDSLLVAFENFLLCLNESIETLVE